MKIFQLALVAACSASSAQALSVTYDVVRSINPETAVIGTITTNGTLGVLDENDIIDWSFSVVAPGLGFVPENSFSLASGGSFRIDEGVFSATQTALIFDYDFVPVGGDIAISVSFLGEGSSNLYCLAGFFSICGASGADEAIIDRLGRNTFASRSGQQIIGFRTGAFPVDPTPDPVPDPAPAPVPLPASLPALLGALGIFASLRTRRA